MMFFHVALSLIAAVAADMEECGLSLLQTSVRIQRSPVSAPAAQAELYDIQQKHIPWQSGIGGGLHVVGVDVFPELTLSSLTRGKTPLTRTHGFAESSTQMYSRLAGMLALIGPCLTFGFVTVYVTHTPGAAGVSTARENQREHSGALTIVASMVIGSIAACLYFVFNAPGAIELMLQESYGVTPPQMGWILGCYSVAGALTPLFANLAISMFGLKIAGLIYVGLIGTGAMLFALAPLCGSWMLTVMFFGRVLSGLGVGVIVLSRSASNWWFKGGPHESLSYGVILVMEQAVGSALPFIILPGLEVNFANWVSVLVSSVSIGLVGVYALLEKAYMPELSSGGGGMAVSKLLTSTGEGAVAQYLKGIPQFNSLFWCQCLAHFFIISILYVFATTFPFFLVQHGLTPYEAGRACAVVYLCVALAPLAGSLSDRLGQRLRLQLICSAIGCVALLSYEVMAPNHWTVCLVLGLCFAVLEQNSYSLMSRIVQHLDDELASMAFAVMTVFLEAGLVGLPVLVGYMGRNDDFSNSPRLFAFFMGSGALVTLFMAKLDSTGFLDGTNQPKTANAGDLSERWKK